MSLTLQGQADIIRAGDTLTFGVSISAFPASAGWLLKFYLTRGKDVVTAAGAQVGSTDNFTVTLPATEAAKLYAGIWQRSLVFTLADQRQTVSMSAVQVLPDPANPKLSRNREIAENLEAVIAGRALPFGDVESSNINGQQVVNMTSADLMKWLVFYKSKANAEDERNSPGSPSHVRPYYPR